MPPQRPNFLSFAGRADLDEGTAYAVCRMIDVVGYQIKADWDWDWLKERHGDYRSLIDRSLAGAAWNLLVQKDCLSLQTTSDEMPQMSTIEPLEGLTNLRSLVLQNNLITDLRPLSGMVKLRYLNCYGNRIAELAPLKHLRSLEVLELGDNPLASVTRGTDLGGSREGAGGIGGLLARTDHARLAIGDSSGHAYYHADGNGNVTALINDKQVIVARYSYDPFGNILSRSGPLADVNTYRFSSKDYHANSGLYYYCYRFHDPNLQRWLNRDPIAEAGGINPYRFVNNDPLSWIDFFGLKAGECYPSSAAAAVAALQEMNPCSIARDIEFAGVIYLKSKGCYSYTGVGQVSVNGIDIFSLERVAVQFAAELPIPLGKKVSVKSLTPLRPPN